MFSQGNGVVVGGEYHSLPKGLGRSLPRRFPKWGDLEWKVHRPKKRVIISRGYTA